MEISDLSKYKDIVITTHMIPDGDAIGSSVALKHMIDVLKFKNVNVRIICTDTCPENLKFIDKYDYIKLYDSDRDDLFILRADCIISVDVSEPNRFGRMKEVIMESKAVKICIDHHHDPNEMWEILLSDVHASSTCEIIANAFLPITAPLEDINFIKFALYVGIVTDSGSFRYERTSAELHDVARYLMEDNPLIQSNKIYDSLYNSLTVDNMKFIGYSISKIDYLFNNKLAILVLNNSDFQKFNVNFNDGYMVNNYLLMLKDVELTIMVTENENGEVRVSLRSKGNVNTLRVSNPYGGGGHKNASGIWIKNMTPEQFKSDVIMLVHGLNLFND